MSYWDYLPDTGCEYAPACLSCPFATCRFDRPPKAIIGERHWIELAPLIEAGMTNQQAANATGLSRRTVMRLHKQARDGVFDGTHRYT